MVLGTTDGGSTWAQTIVHGLMDVFGVSCPAGGSGCWAVGLTAGDVVVLAGST